MYLEMETTDLEFAHYLAQKLGKFLWELDAMPAAEYVSWSIYYGRKAQREQLAMRSGR